MRIQVYIRISNLTESLEKERRIGDRLYFITTILLLSQFLFFSTRSFLSNISVRCCFYPLEEMNRDFGNSEFVAVHAHAGKIDRTKRSVLTELTMRLTSDTHIHLYSTFMHNSWRLLRIDHVCARCIAMTQTVFPKLYLI